MIISSKNISLVQIVSKIFKNLSYRRKKQLGFLSFLILISSFFEILTLSSIQPFLFSLEQSNNIISNENNELFSKILFNDQRSLVYLLIVFIMLLILKVVLTI